MNYSTDPRPFYAARPPHDPPGRWRIAIVVCPPRDAMGLLHPNRVPGRSIVAPQELAAYHPTVWAAAWALPAGEVGEVWVDRLPLLGGNWLDRDDPSAVLLPDPSPTASA